MNFDDNSVVSLLLSTLDISNTVSQRIHLGYNPYYYLQLSQTADIREALWSSG